MAQRLCRVAGITPFASGARKLARCQLAGSGTISFFLCVRQVLKVLEGHSENVHGVAHDEISIAFK